MTREAFAESPSSPFDFHEILEKDNRRILMVNANSAEARAMSAEDFWQTILKSRMTVGDANKLAELLIGSDETGEVNLNDPTELPDLPLEIARFFGKPEAPDELVVAYPLFDTSEETPPKAMVRLCAESGSALTGGGFFSHDVVFPALFESKSGGHITLVSVGEADWASSLTRFDGQKFAGFTVFRAIAIKVPRHFLNEAGIFGPQKNLDDDQWQILTGN